MRPQLHLVSPEEAARSPYPKASLFLRLGARVVDVAIAWALYVSAGPAGLLGAMLYLLFADGMLLGQSLGKKAFGVKVVFLPSRAPARHRDSVLRNAPFGLVVLLGMMPDLGLKAFLAGLVVIGGIEALRCWKDPLGARLGDLWAQTQVTDGKVVDAQMMPVGAREEARATGRVMLERPTPPR
ncbi:MAG: RDD family protein [Myxococcaceae bacterium]|nr:RDD family protein [Myxococcaceae bacterium]